MSIFTGLVIVYSILMTTWFLVNMRARSRHEPVTTYRPRLPHLEHHAKSGKIYHDPPMTPLDEAIMDTSRSLWEVVQEAEKAVTNEAGLTSLKRRHPELPSDPDLCGSANPSGSRLCALPPGHYPELHQWNRLPASQGPKTINEQRADQGFSRYIEGIGYIRAESTEKLKRACEVAIRQHDNQMAHAVMVLPNDLGYIPLGHPGHEISYASHVAKRQAARRCDTLNDSKDRICDLPPGHGTLHDFEIHDLAAYNIYPPDYCDRLHKEYGELERMYVTWKDRLGRTNWPANSQARNQVQQDVDAMHERLKWIIEQLAAVEASSCRH